MKFRYLSLGAVAFGFVIGGLASPANADIPGGSGCQGSVVWQKDGLVVVAATTGGVYTIQRKDTVSWEGSVAGPPGVYSGYVSVDLPPPFGEVVLDDWSGDSQTTSNSGTYDYDLPSLVPAGVEFEVYGEHVDKNGGCSGTITFKIAGSFFSSIIILLSIGGTALFFFLLLFLLLKPLFMGII